RRSDAFAHFAGFSTGAVTLTGSGDPLRVAAAWATPAVFPDVGTQLVLGRVFTPDESQTGRSHAADLSDGLWRSRLVSNLGIIGNARRIGLVLMAGVGCMLLIACTSVASLLLARGEERWRELATRAALGATRMRILNQVLIENLLLFVMGGAIGLAIAFAALKFISAGDYLEVAQVGGVRLDLRILAFTATASLA